MANERTYPALPCTDIDEAISFYGSLGFRKTYRQVRPNPYAVVALEDIQIHLFGMEGFDPAQSYGTVIIAVPDPDRLYQDFAAGLRKAYGKLPVAGIPRILRPRKKYGTVRGFSVVDVGGNWLRIYKLGETEEEDSAEKAEGKGS
jgi:catechol 2,3-dioxygenase-like lactoylglutathione lyase family enzyme